MTNNPEDRAVIEAMSDGLEAGVSATRAAAKTTVSTAQKAVQKTGETAKKIANAPELKANGEATVNKYLEMLKEKGVQPNQEVKIKIGSRNIYKGSIDGSGQRIRLNEKQTKDLGKVLSMPAHSEATIKILVDGNEKLNSQHGTPVKDDYKLSGALRPSREETLKAQAAQKPVETQAARPVLTTPPPLKTEATQKPAVTPVAAPPVGPSQTPAQRFDTALKNAANPPKPDQAAMEKIEQLQGRITQLEAQVKALKEKPPAVQEKSRVNDRVNSWVNKQRDRVASQLYKFGDKIASESQRQVRQGLERQTEAFTNLRSTVENGINQTFDTAKENALKGALGAIDAAHQKADSVTNPVLKKAEESITKLVNNLGNDSQVKLAPDGSRSIESRDLSYKIKPEGQGVEITRKTDGSKVTAKNMSKDESKILSGLSQDVDQKLKPAEQPAQEQKTKQKIGR